MKCSLPIEKLLSWAYCEELPKQQKDLTWATMFSSEAWALGCRVDQSSSGDCLPEILGPPHPDAYRVYDAVQKLEPARINWEDDAEWLLGHLVVFLDWDEVASRCGSVEIRMAGNRHAEVTGAKKWVDGHVGSARGLIEHHAVTHSRPIWYLGEVEEVPLRWPNGRPKIANGEDRPTMLGPVDAVKGKVRPVYYSTIEPSAICIAEARFEYWVWRRALDELCLSLTDLREFRPESSILPHIPWQCDSRLSVVNVMKSDLSTASLDKRDRVLA